LLLTNCNLYAMLDISFIRSYPERVKQNCVNRRVVFDVDALLALDEKRKNIQAQVDVLRAKRNAMSKTKPTEDQIIALRALGDEIREGERILESTHEQYAAMLKTVPNLTHPDTPVGGEEDFVVLEIQHEAPAFDFEPKDHEALLTNLDMVDFERGAKVTGSKFYFVKNDFVRLNQALIQYGMEILSQKGFVIMETPDLAKQDILVGAGFNPRGAEKQIYNIEEENLSLIGTAEITTLGYHADEVLDLGKGPLRYAALSHCFRTEAGSYGRTSKGLYRVHQFTKLEMFIFCKPEESESLHRELLDIEKEICDGLELAYRVIDVASGDLGNPAYRKFDIEAWMVMKQGYGEITSTSNCTDYQARRLNIRYKTEKGTDFVHTLNGTAIALSRFPLAFVEQHQQKDGRIRIPEKLRPFFHKEYIG